MKNIKANLAVIALILGTLAAFATKTPSNNNPLVVYYGYDQTVISGNPWVEVGTAGYQCISSSEQCKYSFDTPPSSTTPRSAGTPSGSELGSYQLID